VKVCGQWDASFTIGQSYLETKISVLVMEYQKKFQLACISEVPNIINLPYYVWNLKVKLGFTIAPMGSWCLLSQRPRLILVQSLWECADIDLFSFYLCPRYVFLHWSFSQYGTILVINTLLNETLKEKARSFHSFPKDHLASFHHVYWNNREPKI